MKDKFLSKESFERQSFVEWMRTGKYYSYKDYLGYIIKLKKKSASDVIEDRSGINSKDFIPEKGKNLYSVGRRGVQFMFFPCRPDI